MANRHTPPHVLDNVEGRPDGPDREWHTNGTLAAERVFAADGLTLLEDREWDEDVRPTRTWCAVAAPVRIDIDDPEVDFDDGERLFYPGEPFTGEVVEYQGGALVSLETYRDGIVDGPVKQWFEDGTLRAEGNAHGISGRGGKEMASQRNARGKAHHN